MQPYINPNYFNYNPYPIEQRINSLQQYQQALQPPQIPVLSGRVVDNFDSITANDVPMNGQAVFVKSDGSEVQVRAWGKMGSIEKTSYVPTSNDDGETASNDGAGINPIAEDILKRLDGIEEQLNDIKRYRQNGKQPDYKAKKDGGQNESNSDVKPAAV